MTATSPDWADIEAKSLIDGVATIRGAQAVVFARALIEGCIARRLRMARQSGEIAGAKAAVGCLKEALAQVAS